MERPNHSIQRHKPARGGATSLEISTLKSIKSFIAGHSNLQQVLNSIRGTQAEAKTRCVAFQAINHAHFPNVSQWNKYCTFGGKIEHDPTTYDMVFLDTCMWVFQPCNFYAFTFIQ